MFFLSRYFRLFKLTHSNDLSRVKIDNLVEKKKSIDQVDNVQHYLFEYAAEHIDNVFREEGEIRFINILDNRVDEIQYW